MLQVESGRECLNFPAGELALQHAAKLFAEVLALAHAGAVDGLGEVEIDESETARFAAKLLNGAIEDAGGVAINRDDAAGDAAGFVPNFDGQAARTYFEGEATCEERYGIFTEFEGGGAAAGGEKGLDGGEKKFGIGRRGQLIVVGMGAEFHGEERAIFR